MKIDILRKIFGSQNDRELKRLRQITRKINSYEPDMQKLTDAELQAQTGKFREMLKNGATLEEILPEAYATIREASVRVLHMRPYDVQVMGGIVLFEGKIAEMKTGEGKTLTATFPLYLHGLTQLGAHIVTVNDYLASRDARDMGELYKWMGLTVGCILTDMSDEDRHAAYNSDITYGTNNEFAFDYLRDNMKFDLKDYVQRPHNYCIVDEVDSILIDEARTPLLISGPSEGTGELYKLADQIVQRLVKDKHFEVNEKEGTAFLKDEGVSAIQQMLKIDNLFRQEHAPLVHHINQALRAYHLFHRDQHYVVKEGQVVIVDEFTGRLKAGSRWSDGLHQAVEAKEKVEIKRENQTLASITFQNYFKFYKRLAGMTGTADTEAEEFKKIYNLEVVVIPTNNPMIRIDEPDVIYKTKDAKFNAVVKLIENLYSTGQPVLVGTISIENSELISERLKKLNIPHEILNAKNHAREAEIISRAGQVKSVTIATNMAGRGTDIKPSKEAVELGGLFILGTERHDSRRIDNQLRGRSGRQGDPGRSKFFLSLEDDLMRVFGSKRIQGFMNTLGMKDDEPIEHKMITKAIAKAQKKVEGYHFEIRKHLLKYDNVMNDQRLVIHKLRREILGDIDNMGLVNDMIEDVATDIAQQIQASQERKVPIDALDWDKLNNIFKQVFSTDYHLTADECYKEYEGLLEEYFAEVAKKALKEKFAEYSEEDVKQGLKQILLSIFDQYWKDHLLNMDHVKEGINLRAYAQRDPLAEYKKEAFNLFEQMRHMIKMSVVQNVFKIHFYTEEELEEVRRRQEEALAKQLEEAKRAQEAKEKGEEPTRTVKRTKKKIGRNDPCPCGSGKKFKNCHGA